MKVMRVVQLRREKLAKAELEDGKGGRPRVEWVPEGVRMNGLEEVAPNSFT